MICMIFTRMILITTALFTIIAALSPMDVQKVVGKKVAIGRNNWIQQYTTPTLHAEMDAYQKLQPYYKSIDLDMIVVRFTRDGQLRQSRPCYHCIKMLSNSGLSIKNVYYSRDGDMHKEKFCDMMHSPLTQVSSGMRNKAANPLRRP